MGREQRKGLWCPQGGPGALYTQLLSLGSLPGAECRGEALPAFDRRGMGALCCALVHPWCAEHGQVRAELWAGCRVTCGRGAEGPELPWLPSLPGKLQTPASRSRRSYQIAAPFLSSFSEFVISAKIQGLGEQKSVI